MSEYDGLELKQTKERDVLTKAFNWLTGRNSIYADTDKMENVKACLKYLEEEIIDGENGAKAACSQAMYGLKQVPGLGSIIDFNEHAFDPVYDQIKQIISETIGAKIEASETLLKEFNETAKQDPFGVAIGSIGMGLCKTAEGILSFGEDILDTGATIIGGIGGGWWSSEGNAFSNAMKNFVSKDLANTLTTGWYENTPIGKKSAFTADSGLGSFFELAGETTAFLFTGGFISGLPKVASSVTKVNTVLAATTGFGSAAEKTFNEGGGYWEATGRGALNAGIQAGAAFAVGKAGGYNDSITKAGQEYGKQGLGKGLNSIKKDLVTGVKNIGAPLNKSNGKELNTLQQTYNKIAKKKGGRLVTASFDLAKKATLAGPNTVLNATKAAGRNIATAVTSGGSKGAKALGTAAQVFGDATALHHEYGLERGSDKAIDRNIDVELAVQQGKDLKVPTDVYQKKGEFVGNSGSQNNPGGTPTGPSSTGNTSWGGGVTQPTTIVTEPITPPEIITPTEPTEPVTPTEPVIPTEPTEPTNPTQPTTPTEPTTPENPGTTITNPEPTPTPPVRNDNGGSNSGVDHGGNWSNGGNYNNGSENFWSGITDNGEVTEPELPDGELPIEEPTDTELPGTEESVYTIPTDLSGVTTKKKSSSGSSVIPILGGLGAAAAVGVGAKIYMDNKKNNDNGEDDDYADDFEFKDDNNNDLLADEWKEDNNDTSLNFNDIINEASEDNNNLGEI